jgi:hypothetical protein
MVWVKNRVSTIAHRLYDTNRGVYKELYTNLTNAEVDRTSISAGISSFNTNGFSFGNNNYNGTNESGINYVSWTFREQAKFFDVVTWTGNSTYGRTISHNLGSVPGCIIVKCTSVGATNWCVYHRGLTTPTDQGLYLTATDAAGDVAFWAYTAPTSTVFSLSASDQVNATGSTYVAYLWAHNAGGFGLLGADNVITCGNATVSGNATSVTLGYEPQWVMMKRTSGISDWFIVDNMRGFSATLGSPFLRPNSANAESANTGTQATATGFTSSGVFDNGTYIYIAIRRGPMAIPTVGTSVFSTQTYTGDSASNRFITTNTVVDTNFITTTDSSVGYRCWSPRLTGGFLETNDDGSPYNDLYDWTNFASNVGFSMPSAYSYSNSSGSNYITYSFSRAPSFHDVVYYTGTGTATTVAHNLGVAPEFMIAKTRQTTGSWWTYLSVLTAPNNVMFLNDTMAATNATVWNSTAPTSTVFSVGSALNTNGLKYIAYLFATCPGVSKVGSYTGTGALQTINCGFATGARFIMIKRTDATGGWYFYDSSRGITSGNDPYMFMNATGTNVTNTNYVDTTGVGFQVTAAAPAALNASGGTYIFLAIA